MSAQRFRNTARIACCLFATILLLTMGSCKQENEIESQIRLSGKDFRQLRKKPSLSEFLFVKTIRSHGQCRQLQAIRGFSELTDRECLLFTTDALVSDLFTPDGSGIEEEKPYNPKSGPGDLVTYISSSRNDVNSKITFTAWQAEQVMPLAKGQYDRFEYTILDGPDGTRTVSFRAKTGYFPTKAHIFGKGELTFDADGIPSRLRIENADMRIVKSTRPPAEIITPYCLEIEYTHQNGSLSWKSVSLDVSWALPDNPDTSCYAIEFNPYRNPFKHQVSTSTRLIFGRPVQIDYDIDTLRTKSVRLFSCYTDGPDIASWHDLLGTTLDSALCDMNVSDSTICEQTRKNALAYQKMVQRVCGEDMAAQLNRVRSASQMLFPDSRLDSLWSYHPLTISKK